jgi:hypothetical protein
MPGLYSSSAYRAVLRGKALILKYVARAAAKGTPPLYGTNPFEACAVDQWIDFTSSNFVSGPALAAAARATSASLALGTFLVGHSLQFAAMWPKVRNLPEASNLKRWFEYVSAQPEVTMALGQFAPQRPAKEPAKV